MMQPVTVEVQEYIINVQKEVDLTKKHLTWGQGESQCGTRPNKVFTPLVFIQSVWASEDKQSLGESPVSLANE